LVGVAVNVADTPAQIELDDVATAIAGVTTGLTVTAIVKLVSAAGVAQVALLAITTYT
jgi:hypothetical protein